MDRLAKFLLCMGYSCTRLRFQERDNHAFVAASLLKDAHTSEIQLSMEGQSLQAWKAGKGRSPKLNTIHETNINFQAIHSGKFEDVFNATTVGNVRKHSWQRRRIHKV